jgi:hypothetical protein
MLGHDLPLVAGAGARGGRGGFGEADGPAFGADAGDQGEIRDRERSLQEEAERHLIGEALAERSAPGEAVIDVEEDVAARQTVEEGPADPPRHRVDALERARHDDGAAPRLRNERCGEDQAEKSEKSE